MVSPKAALNQSDHARHVPFITVAELAPAEAGEAFTVTRLTVVLAKSLASVC